MIYVFNILKFKSNNNVCFVDNTGGDGLGGTRLLAVVNSCRVARVPDGKSEDPGDTAIVKKRLCL